MNAEQLKRARELQDLGARLDDEILEQAVAQLSPLSIRPITQACRLYEVRDLPEGGMGLKLGCA